MAEDMSYTDEQQMRSGESAPIARKLNMGSSLLDNQRQYIENQMMPPGPYIQPEQKIEEIPGTGMVWINGKGPFADPREQKSEPMDLAWQMLFKAGIEVHHDEPLPQEFTQDITTLDRQHKMVPTENGTMIDNISPHMLRTIELMAQNHKDDDTFTPKPFEMPTTFY